MMNTVRLIRVFCAVALGGMIGLSALADGTFQAIIQRDEVLQYPTLAEAIGAANPGEQIVLCSNLKLSGDLDTSGKPVIIMVPDGVALDCVNHSIGAMTIVSGENDTCVKNIKTPVRATVFGQQMVIYAGSFDLVMALAQDPGMTELLEACIIEINDQFDEALSILASISEAWDYGMEMPSLTFKFGPAYKGYPQAWVELGSQFIGPQDADASFDFNTFNFNMDPELGESERDLAMKFSSSGLSTDADPSEFLANGFTIAEITRLNQVMQQAMPFLDSGDWIADFVVYFDKGLEPNTLQLVGSLPGMMDGCIPIDVDFGLPAFQRYRMIYEYTGGWGELIDYNRIFMEIPIFSCGVKSLSKINAGTKMSVELRLYAGYARNDQMPPSILIGTYDHTLTAPELEIDVDSCSGLDWDQRARVKENTVVSNFRETGMSKAIDGDGFGSISLQLTDATVANDVISSMTFNVQPQLLTRDQETRDLESLRAPVTFRLPVDSGFAAEWVKVSRNGEFFKNYPVKTEMAARMSETTESWEIEDIEKVPFKYIEITTDQLPGVFSYEALAEEDYPALAVDENGNEYKTLNDIFAAAMQGSAMQFMLVSDYTLPFDLENDLLPITMMVDFGVTLDCAGHAIGNMTTVLAAEGATVKNVNAVAKIADIPGLGTAYFGSLDLVMAMVLNYAQDPGMAELFSQLKIEIIGDFENSLEMLSQVGEIPLPDGIVLPQLTFVVSPDYTGYPKAWTVVDGEDAMDLDTVDISYSFYAFNPNYDPELGESDWDAACKVFDGQELTAKEQERFERVEGQMTDYDGWYADFEVFFNRPVKRESMSVTGAFSMYENDMSMTFKLDRDMAAYERYRLLGSFGATMDYATIYSMVRKFRCGAKNYSMDNVGTTMTVELRLYNPEYGDLSILAGSYDYLLAGPEIVLSAGDVAGISDANLKLILGSPAVIDFKQTGLGSSVNEGDYAFVGMRLTSAKEENGTVTAVEFEAMPAVIRKGSVDTEALENVTGALMLRLPVFGKTDGDMVTVLRNGISLGEYPVQSIDVNTMGSTDHVWHDKDLSSTVFQYVEFPAKGFPASYGYGMAVLNLPVEGEQGGNVAIEVTDAIVEAAKAAVGEDATPEQLSEKIAEELNKTADNGLKVMENVLVEQAVASGARVETGFAAVEKKTVEVDGKDVIQTTIAKNVSMETSNVKAVELETGTYQPTKVVPDAKGNLVAVPDTDAKAIAVVNNKSANKTVALPIPDETTLDKVIETQPDEGDVIQAYDKASKAYLSWRYDGSGWQPINTSVVGGQDVENKTPASAKILPAGSVIKYEKVNAVKQVVVKTDFNHSVSSTPTEVPDETDGNPKWNLMANPTGKAFDLATVNENVDSNDRIVVLPTSGLGQVELKRKGGKWGCYKTRFESGRMTKVWCEDTKVEGGQALWYISSGGQPTIEWNKGNEK